MIYIYRYIILYQISTDISDDLRISTASMTFHQKDFFFTAKVRAGQYHLPNLGPGVEGGISQKEMLKISW